MDKLKFLSGWGGSGQYLGKGGRYCPKLQFLEGN